MAFTAPAFADGHALRSAFAVFFASHDSDANGSLDMAEMYQLGQNVFVSMDADSDRNVTKDEFLGWDIGTGELAAEAGRTDMLKVAQDVFFVHLDNNNDGQFSRGEWRQLHVQGSARADANDDAQTTFEEFWGGFPVVAALRAGLGQ